MHFDEILTTYIGELGLYQILLLIFSTSLGIFGGLNNIDYIFIGAEPEKRCDVLGLSHLSGNLTDDQLMQLISPKLDDGYDTCRMYDRNYSTLSLSDVNQILSNGTDDNIIPCTSWVYSQEQFISTVATEWDLVCDRYWLVSTSQSVFMAGKFGIFLGGWMSDRFGRRLISLVMLTINIAGRILASWAPNYTIFLIARFLLASSGIIMYASVFIIAIEMVGPKYRALAGQLPYIYWSVGYMIVALMAYLIRDWRMLSWAFLIFFIPFLLQYYFLPESVRWLQTKNKIKQVKKQVHLMAKVNRKTLPDDSILFPEKLALEKSEQKPGVLQVLRQSKGLIKTTCILMYIWFAINFIYYGIIFYVPKMGGNIYLSTFFSGLIEIPALLAVQLTFDTRLGRRFCTCAGFMMCGAAVLTIIVVPKHITWLIITLAMIGRIFSTYVYSAIYVYTSELYPTSLRASCSSICSTVARLGGVIAPYMVLLSRVYTYLPEILFGIFTCTAGLLTLLLHETAGRSLPDTIKECNNNQGENHMDEIAKELEPMNRCNSKESDLQNQTGVV